MAMVLPLLAIAAAGCNTTTGSSSNTLFGGSSFTSSAGKPHNPSAGETAKWARAWKNNQADVRTTMEYVARLRALGSSERALSVLEDSIKANPTSTVLQGEYGKQLANAGELEKASVVLQRAAAAPDSTWQIHSIKGVVMDRMDRNADAQVAYRMALRKSPGEISVLNNLGLSQAMSGDLESAERTLQMAYGTPQGRANSRLRQNLALVIGIRGRFEEVKRIVMADLPPQQVEQNISYLRHMLSQPDPWKKLSRLDDNRT